MARTEIEIKGDTAIYFPLALSRVISQDPARFTPFAVTVRRISSPPTMTYMKCHCGDREDNVAGAAAGLSHQTATFIFINLKTSQRRGFFRIIVVLYYVFFTAVDVQNVYIFFNTHYIVYM